MCIRSQAVRCICLLTASTQPVQPALVAPHNAAHHFLQPPTMEVNDCVNISSACCEYVREVRGSRHAAQNMYRVRTPSRLQWGSGAQGQTGLVVRMKREGGGGGGGGGADRGMGVWGRPRGGGGGREYVYLSGHGVLGTSPGEAAEKV